MSDTPWLMEGVVPCGGTVSMPHLPHQQWQDPWRGRVSGDRAPAFSSPSCTPMNGLALLPPAPVSSRASQ